jgi:hypothetical protein
MSKLVDFFVYYDPTGRQLTELRMRMYENLVDEFVVCETNVTHSGLPARQGLDSLITEVNLPREKIRRLELNIPYPPPIEETDYLNSYEGNSENLNSVYGRARERMQRNSLMSILDEYDDDTFFMISDQDEIINPDYIPWALKAVESNPDGILKIPLVHLEGRADLRVNVREDSRKPERHKEWDAAMFICKKHHLKRASVLMIRSLLHSRIFPPIFLSLDGKRVEDMGWHFSWMGSAKERIAKVEGFCHYQDKFSWLETGSYDSPETKTLLTQMYLADGMIPPSCNKFEVLRDYPQECLPKMLFDLPRVKAYLLPQSQPEGV